MAKTLTMEVVSQAEKASSVDPRRWLMLAVLLLTTFLGTLDTYIVNVAIPSIQTNLHASFTEIQLVIAGYILAFAVVLATGGRLGDLYGRKRLLLLGVTGFTLCSACCGLAPTATWLIIFRVLQGGMAALMLPQVVSPTGCATSFTSTAIRFESILHRFSFSRKRRCLNPCPWTSASVERACQGASIENTAR